MSKGAASSTEVSELECSICNEHFNKPKILPCGHLGCRHCLIRWFETKPDAGCPLCRDVSGSVQSTTGLQKTSVTSVVDGLPTDLAMAALVDAHHFLSQQHDCIICGQKATALCLDCNDAFCHSCQSVHTKQSIARGHTLRVLSSLTPETLVAGKPATCADHMEEACKVFCPTHGAALCMLCATTTHRQCHNVVSLQVRQREVMAELQELSSLLKNGERKLDLSVDQLDQHIKHTNQRLEQALQDIQARYNCLKKALKDSRHREMDEVRKAAANIIEDANDVKSELKQRQGKMSAHQTITQRSQQHGLESSAADVHAQLKDRVTDLVRSATMPLNKMVKSFTFTFNPEVLKRIERDLLQIGKVTFAPCTDVEMLVQPTAFEFLSNKHGERITLCNDDTTAEKVTDDSGEGFVVSKEPMETQMLYERSSQSFTHTVHGTQSFRTTGHQGKPRKTRCILIIGRAGQGKSNVGNIILGEKKFVEGNWIGPEMHMSSTVHSVQTSTFKELKVIVALDILYLTQDEQAQRREVSAWKDHNPDAVLLTINCDWRASTSKQLHSCCRGSSVTRAW